MRQNSSIMLCFSNLNSYLFLAVLMLANTGIFSQISIEGYVYESGNRGFIEGAEVALVSDTEIIARAQTNRVGRYTFAIDEAGKYELFILKKPYFESKETISVKDNPKHKVYLKHEVTRKPGYVFELTLAEKNAEPDAPKTALNGALIEVYNNTTMEEELVLPALTKPEFVVNLLKGNHYTILIRKEGFLSKRMEAFVDVDGCILCFEGIGQVQPGVSDNLTEQNNAGVLLANVELDRYHEGKVIGLNDIYYEFGKADITTAAKEELDNIVTFLKDNPNITVELGSHTDSRGKAAGNLKLSEKRAQVAAKYLTNMGGISSDRITAKGYGETKLLNDCDNNSDCSEEEHAKNRRTELTILQASAFDISTSLRQMKSIELMDQILANLDRAGQIQVGEGGDIAALIADRDKVIYGSSKTIQDIEDLIDQNISKAESTVKHSEKLLAPAQEAEENIIEEATETSIEEKAPPAITEKVLENSSTTIKENNPAKTNTDKTPVMSEPVAMPEQYKEPDPTDVPAAIEESLAPKESAPIKTEQKTIPTTPNEPVSEEVTEWLNEKDPLKTNVEISDDISSNVKDIDSYTGYKIVIHFSRYQLPETHQLYEDHKDIVDYITADQNHLYMIGDFKTKSQAETYVKSKIRETYPHAYIVGFEKGVRVY